MNCCPHDKHFFFLEKEKKKKNPTIRFVCFYNLGWLHLLYFLLLGWMHFFFLNLLLKLYIELKKQNSAGFCCDLKTPKWINALYSGFPPLYTQTFASKHDLWEFPVFSMRQHSIDLSLLKYCNQYTDIKNIYISPVKLNSEATDLGTTTEYKA